MTRTLFRSALLVAGVTASAFFSSVLPARAAGPIVRDVAAGAHALAVLDDGTVIGWGRNYAGQLGELARPGGVRKAAAVPLAGKARQVAVISETSYALLEDGSVWSWGRGFSGELGIGPAGKDLRVEGGNPGTKSPQRVLGVDNAIQIAASGSSAFALRADGTVWGWGSPDSAILVGAPSSPATPFAIAGLVGITRIAVSPSHGLALAADGRVWAWGSNKRGELGLGISGSAEGTPKQISGLQNVVSIAAGSETSAAVTGDGSVWVWGGNQYGHHADGKMTDFGAPGDIYAAPQKVPGLTTAASVQIGTPGRQTMVLLKDGTMRGWGNSDWGQIGAGVSGQSQPTVQKVKVAKVQRFWASGNTSFMLRTDGTLLVCGSETGGTGLLAKNQKVPVALVLTAAA